MIPTSSIGKWLARGPREPKLEGAERVMHWLAVASCLFFGAVAFWESFGAARTGHVSTSAGYAIAGENMVHWRKFAVYAGYLAKPANPDQYYCHHPYGITFLDAIAYLLFGHHWFTTRAAAIFCSVISPPFLYGFGRRAWGVIPASVATIFFCFVPIDLSFSNFGNLEEPTIAFGLLFAWGTAGVWQTSKTRYLVASAIGALGAANGDWAGLVFLGPVVVFGFFRAYVLPRRWYGRLDERTYARWFAYGMAMAIGTLVGYLVLFGKADKINDLVGSYHLRSSGAEAAITDQLNAQRRKLWLGVMLTPISFGAMGAGLPLAAIRLLKKPLEIFPLAWFLAASFQYFVFKQGADIHIFWPHYYAPTAALAAGTLTASLLCGRGVLVRFAQRATAKIRLQRFVAVSTALVVGLGVGIPLFLLARMGVPMLVQSRKTGGQFDQGGKFITTGADLAEFAQWAYANVATQGSTVQVLERYEYYFSSEYGGNRPYTRVNSITAAKPDDVQRIALVDTRTQSQKDLENIAKNFGVESVGPLWRVDRAVKGPAFTALRLEEREPNPLEWMFISGTDLVRKISRDEDPYQTWEIRDAMNIPAPAPTVPPVSVDDLRIAHNIALRDGDAARAGDLASKVAGMMQRRLDLQYTGGIRLDGIDVHYGPAIVVTLFWSTDQGYKPSDLSYQLKCKIIAPPRLWKTQLDYFENELAPVPLIRPANWKANRLYTNRFTALHRIGKEECRLWFSGGLHPVSGDQNPVVLTMD